MVGLRADVDAAGRVGGDEHPRLAAHLAADHQLLLVAAGQREGGHVDAGGAHAVLPHDARGVLPAGLAVDPRTAAPGPARLVAQHAVLPERRPAAAGPAGAGPPGRSRSRPRGAGAPTTTVTSVSPRRTVPVAARSPSSASTSSAWPLPSTPAMPSTSPRRTDSVTSSTSARPSGERTVSALDRQLDDVGDGRVAGLRRRQLAADHELGELARRTCRPARAWDRRAAAQHRDAVRDAQHLVELVADEHDGDALGAQVAQRAEQLVDLLRHEHGGRLVEDQHPRAAVQHLEDLDALPVADAEVLDDRVGVDAQAVLVGQLADARGGPSADVEPAEPRRLRAEHDVLQDGQVVGQHEVLVDHADAGGDRVGRAPEAHLARRRRRSCRRRGAASRTGSS